MTGETELNNSLSNSEKYNECNPRDDSYCIFERQYNELKEKMKFYLEPFELRPTYQELEKKLEKIKIAWNNRVFSSEGDDFGETLKEILDSQEKVDN